MKSTKNIISIYNRKKKRNKRRYTKANRWTIMEKYSTTNYHDISAVLIGKL